MPTVEQDHKRNTMAGFNMSRDAIGTFNVLHLWLRDSSLLHCGRVIIKCATPTDGQDHKRNTTVWRPFFFSFISVCVFAIFTPLVPNWFKPTQNHSRVYTHWRHKRNTSIWEHQHDIFIDRYVLCSFYSKYALIVHGLAMPFYYSRCILTDPQAEKKSVWEHQPTTSIDQYVPSLFNIINDEFILIYT